MASSVETAIRDVITKGATLLADSNRKRLPQLDEHPYLTGINAPIGQELTLEQLEVTGTIPLALDGTYMRIGPNPITPPDAASHHWFLGDGMVHGVRLQGGRALWYRNRWIRSNAVSAALGEPPAPGARRPISDSVNTNVMAIAGRNFALVEGSANPVELDAELRTLSHNPFDGTLTGTYSAHPHRDPETGELHAICYDAQEPTAVRHVVIGRDGRVRREERVPVSGAPSIHDCAMTRRFVLVFDLPVTLSIKRFIQGYRFPYGWNPAHPSRVGLLEKDAPGSSVRWFAVAPCYVFHPCNAYETADGKVVVDVVAHDSMFAESAWGPDSRTVAFERWTIDLAGDRVERRVIDTAPQEFPRFDERLTGLPYRYAYTASVDMKDGSMQQAATRLYRHDLETGERQVHDFGPNRFPGEFVFVADGPGELEGWLMGYVVDMGEETTELAIIDARAFEAAPVARVKIPHRVPAGFHGNWVKAG